MRKPKLRNIFHLRKNFEKSVRKQYGSPDSHAFFKYAWKLNYEFLLNFFPQAIFMRNKLSIFGFLSGENISLEIVLKTFEFL